MSLIRYAIMYMYLYRRMLDPFMYFHKVKVLKLFLYSINIAFDILQRLLTTFIEKLFTPKSFEGEFTLVGNVDGHGKKIIMPDGVQ